MKSVLITGVASGIGQAASQAFGHDGWVVFGVDKKPAPPTAYVDHFFKGDLANETFLSKLSQTLRQKTQMLNALVNNAALQICKPLIQTNKADWDKTMTVNAWAPVSLTQKLLPLLKKGKGSIINVSSVHALATSPGLGAYATSKGTLATLTRVLALELGPYNIRVNAVVPGAVKTKMLLDGIGGRNNGVEKGLKRLAEKHPLKRVGEPSELAQSILFLADPTRSSFMTGQTLTVDGGALAHLSTE